MVMIAELYDIIKSYVHYQELYLSRNSRTSLIKAEKNFKWPLYRRYFHKFINVGGAIIKI